MEGPRARPHGLGSSLDPDRLAQRSPRDGDQDDGDAVGLEHGGTDCLEHSEGDEHAEARSEAAERSSQSRRWRTRRRRGACAPTCRRIGQLR